MVSAIPTHPEAAARSSVGAQYLLLHWSAHAVRKVSAKKSVKESAECGKPPTQPWLRGLRSSACPATPEAEMPLRRIGKYPAQPGLPKEAAAEKTLAAPPRLPLC